MFDSRTFAINSKKHYLVAFILFCQNVFGIESIKINPTKVNFSIAGFTNFSANGGYLEFLINNRFAVQFQAYYYVESHQSGSDPQPPFLEIEHESSSFDCE